MSRWRCGGNHGSREKAFSVDVLENISYTCFVSFCSAGTVSGGTGETYALCASGIVTRKSPGSRLAHLDRRTARPN